MSSSPKTLQLAEAALPAELAPLLAILDQFATALMERLEAAAPAPPAAPLAVWIPVDQASQYSGLSASLIRRLVAAGKLTAVRDHSTKVKKADVDELDPLVIASLPRPAPRVRAKAKK